MRIVVFGWGNDARGDDGLGPLLLARVGRENLPDVATIEDFQLQIEHALDLEGADLALFLDAGKETPAPFAFAEIFAKRDSSPLTHALSPEAVLDVFARTLERTPPPAFVLCVRGERFELGDCLSAEARERLEQAWAFLRRILIEPAPESWRREARGVASKRSNRAGAE